MFPSKELRFIGRAFRLHGLSVDDRYFQTLDDNIEAEFVRFCRRYVRPDYICLDVGANIGLKSLIMAALLPDGRVVAIEPSPKVADVLDLNVRSNGAENITVRREAVVDRAHGSVRFHEDSAFGHISDEGVEVPATTLAALASALALPRVDFIKMDVEGSEYPILKEAIGFINKNEALVYFEFNAWAQVANTDVHPREFARWILSNFSHVFLVTKSEDYSNLLTRIGRTAWFDILHHNFFKAQFVDDIVATNAPWRLEATEAQGHAAMTERDAAVVKRDEALAQIAVLHASTSWRVTAGLRWIRRSFGRKR